ncbi:MAG: hypothetical protein EBU54_16655, partial [Mycobacteriaceae bacterium]|nr:hypothetical protein [Mycobacteriaceae bacterium]
GTELKSGTTKPVVLPFARNVFGYVVAADLVDMPLSTVTANGKTWEEFLRGARERVFPGNTRWPNLEITSGDSASNWNAYALSSHLAISLVLDDEAAVQRDITIYRRFLGDVTSPWPAFKPTSGYTWAGNLLTGSSPGRGWDMTPTLQRGINPAVPGNPRSGAIILDALRNSSVPAGPCCKLDLAGRAYTEESLDALLAINMMLRAQGTDFTNFEDQALRRDAKGQPVPGYYEIVDPAPGRPNNRYRLGYVPFVTALSTPGWMHSPALGQGPDYFFLHLAQARRQLPDGQAIPASVTWIWPGFWLMVMAAAAIDKAKRRE